MPLWRTNDAGQLRHFSATQAVLQGVPIIEVMGRHGWTSYQTAMKYQHYTGARGDEAARAVASVLELASLPRVDAFDALDRSRQEFERRLRLVGADDWGCPTPCTEWTVRDLANHVVGGCRRYTMLLHGATPDETNALRTLDHLGADAAASFVAAADEMTAAFQEPGALTRTVHHPAGDRSGRGLLEMRILDFAVHGWDLARAIGSDDTLDHDLVVLLWDLASAMIPDLVQQGYFTVAEGRLPVAASLQTRLLHLTGREA